MARQYNKKTLEQRAAALEQQAASLREKERKQRTSHLVDLGGAFLALMVKLSAERREKWLAAALDGLTGKALARRQSALAWMREQVESACSEHERAKAIKSNIPPCGGNAPEGGV